MLRTWWQSTSALRRTSPPIERAIALGAQTDRLSLAFLGGYTSAITVLDPTIGPDAIGALCATEDGGGHPRAILTTLTDGVLNGTKHFVSGGSLATDLLVVAKVGDRDGRPELKVARLAASAPGVTITDLPPLDFVPEVPHGSVTFTNAKVDTVLEGDGYERYLKPFRTIEDLHVFAAILGCLLANGRTALPRPTQERFFAALAAIRHLASQSPSSPDTHLALAGVLSISRDLVDGLDLAAFAPDFRERFERDRPLLRIAGKVREQRRLKAWEGR
jgi:acyl-CoA dehydrogenase